MSSVEKWIRDPFLETSGRQLTDLERRAWRQETAARASLWLAHLFRATGWPPDPAVRFADIGIWSHPRGSVSLAATVDAHRVDRDGEVDELILVTDDAPDLAAAFEVVTATIVGSHAPRAVRVMNRRTARTTEILVDEPLLDTGARLLEASAELRGLRVQGVRFDEVAAASGSHCRFCPAVEICGAGSAWYAHSEARAGPLELVSQSRQAE